ncbi:hypothetical protein BDK51DRAFT_44351 [Blyttiomyces helicus]|uniref:Uncharacterized protein n=1 Tax=Blyttiomyces helicus TaxID=388810 RepID=A0A4P9VW91_9FUNG|nr:hypothetical protein BDK51DRAFT_44351 [Blyttiomyces helicus]|eukprot:RKO83954.1 hypothetical protein BDK51DRAFT_44351 [Blyttiomyces helicus]
MLRAAWGHSRLRPLRALPVHASIFQASLAHPVIPAARRLASSSAAVATLRKVASLQQRIGERDAEWVSRIVEAAEGETPFRVAVVGENASATSSFVNALLASPVPVVSEEAPGKVVTIRQAIVPQGREGGGGEGRVVSDLRREGDESIAMARS